MTFSNASVFDYILYLTLGISITNHAFLFTIMVHKASIHNPLKPTNLLLFAIVMGFLATAVHVLGLFLWYGRCGYHYFAAITFALQKFSYALFLVAKAYLVGQNIVTERKLSFFKYVMAALCAVLFASYFANVFFLWTPQYVNDLCVPLFSPYTQIASLFEGLINVLASAVFISVITYQAKPSKGDSVFAFKQRAIYAMLGTACVSLCGILYVLFVAFPPLNLTVLICQLILVNSILVYSSNVSQRGPGSRIGTALSSSLHLSNSFAGKFGHP